MIKISFVKCDVSWKGRFKTASYRVANRKASQSSSHVNQIPRRIFIGASTILLSKFLIQSDTKAAVPIESLIPVGFDFGVVSDSSLAYEFLYPKQELSGKLLPITFFRKPTQYARAAPQSVTGRQRVVCGLGELSSRIVISVTVGPPSSELSEVNIENWNPREVANDVLADRSVSRLTETGRVPLATIENVKTEERDKRTYWIYESILSGSPTLYDKSKETFRHSLNVTSLRKGTNGAPFLYTLTLSCPQELWDDLSPLFELSATSFRLIEETSGYKSPDTSLFGLF